MKIKSIGTIVVLVLALSLISVLTSFYLFENESTDKIISFISNLIRLSFTIGTFLIAILLYDRFGFRRKIYEKKFDLVLDLLDLMKENTLFLRYNNIEENRFSIFTVRPGSRMKYMNYKFANKYSYLVFDQVTIRESVEKLMKYKNNPFLPSEIVSSLKFLDFDELWGWGGGKLEERKYSNEYTQLVINKKSKGELNTLDGWCRMNDDITLESFINSYYGVFESIEKWLDEHSNIKSELNI